MATEPPSAATSIVSPEFRFVTNHGNVLLIARDQHIRIRDIASLLDITERAAQRIVADLSNAGYIEREREGRRNVYSLKTGLPLHLPFQDDVDIDALLSILPVVEPTSSPARHANRSGQRLALLSLERSIFRAHPRVTQLGHSSNCFHRTSRCASVESSCFAHLASDTQAGIRLAEPMIVSTRIAADLAPVSYDSYFTMNTGANWQLNLSNPAMKAVGNTAVDISSVGDGSGVPNDR